MCTVCKRNNSLLCNIEEKKLIWHTHNRRTSFWILIFDLKLFSTSFWLSFLYSTDSGYKMFLLSLSSILFYVIFRLNVCIKKIHKLFETYVDVIVIGGGSCCHRELFNLGIIRSSSRQSKFQSFLIDYASDGVSYWRTSDLCYWFINETHFINYSIMVSKAY